MKNWIALIVLTALSSPAFAGVNGECAKSVDQIRTQMDKTETAWKAFDAAVDTYAAKAGSLLVRDFGRQCEGLYYQLKIDDLQSEIDSKRGEYAYNLNFRPGSVAQVQFDDWGITYAAKQLADVKADRQIGLTASKDELIQGKGKSQLILEFARAAYKDALTKLQALETSDRTCSKAEKDAIRKSDLTDPKEFRLYAFDSESRTAALSSIDDPPPEDPAIWTLPHRGECK